MKKITTKMLQSLGACEERRSAFALRFPDGASWDEVLAAATTPLHQAWLAWLGRHCPADAPGATWEARLAVQRDDSDRALLGRVCPAGVPGATWEVRLAVQRNDRDRAWLGRYCPAGVPGATWEARLAVQRNDRNRAWLGRVCPAGVPGATWEARLSAQRDNTTLPTYLTPAPAAEYDTFDAWFNAIIIMACLLLAVLVGCCAGYAYAQRQRRRPAPIPSQAQLLRQNYANGIYADELADELVD